MRLDKYLSDATAFSRRELKSLIRSGQVNVGGKVIKSPEYQVESDSQVTLKGEAVCYRKFVYLMMNKPAGFISATEDGNAPVVTELLPEEYRHFGVFPAGRLDKDTEGLLILTNDGQFAHQITSPRKQVWKRYFARLDAPASAEDAEVFTHGMDLGDFIAAPGHLIVTGIPEEVFVEITEGKFHQVKRMCAKVGKNVIYLKRCAIGGLTLDGKLQPGQCRELTADELEMLKDAPLPPLEETALR
jgi:16S rRNA pseudouridine516 synthase